MGERIPINHHLAIDEDELTLKFVRASGPGGQNVNKVSTAVELRFDLYNSPNLPDAVKMRAIKLAGSRLTEAGEIILFAERFRTQLANRRDAVERLVSILTAACIVPKARRATKPSKGSKERRLTAKKTRSDVKKGRGRPTGD